MKRISSGQLINVLQVLLAISAYISFRSPDHWLSWMPTSWIPAVMALTTLVTVAFARSANWDGSVSQVVFSTLEVLAYQSLIILVVYSPTLPEWLAKGYPYFFATSVLIANGGQFFQWLSQKSNVQQQRVPYPGGN